MLRDSDHGLGLTRRWLRARPTILVAAVVLSALTVFLWGTSRQATLVNTDMDVSDQSAYMEYATLLDESAFQAVGGRSRMPALPALLALLRQPGMTDQELFRVGKVAGTLLGLGVLGLAFLVFRRGHHVLDALTAVLVAAFTVVVFKAPYVQADVLFYGLYVVFFALLVSLLLEPKPSVAVAAGVTAGLAFLTKASVQPAIVMGAACLGIRALVEVSKPEGLPRARRVLQHVLPTVLLIASFLMVVSPYIHTSKRVFGQYFYNVNTTFYVWYDSWDEVVAGTRAHRDKEMWPAMPSEEIPSLGRYVREHTPAQIARRFYDGVLTTTATVRDSYGYAAFMLLYAALLGALMTSRRAGGLLRAWAVASPAVVVFICGFFAAHVAMAAWYVPIASGNRFILSAFLPFLYVAIGGIAFARKEQLTAKVGTLRFDATWISPVVLAALGIYLLLLFPSRISTMFGGD